MEPTQNPAPHSRRRWIDPGPDVDRRPLWLPMAGLAAFVLSGVVGALAVIGIAPVPDPPGPWSWLTLLFFLLGLSFILVLVIPLVLIALRHRWAGVFLALMGPTRGVAHPRLAELTLAWVGLVLGCMIGAAPFWVPEVPPTLLQLPGSVVIAIVVLGPLAVLVVFDRDRTPPEG